VVSVNHRLAALPFREPGARVWRDGDKFVLGHGFLACMVQPEHVVHGPENHMFGWMHKAVATGLADRFDQGSGGRRRLAFAVPNYSLDACMNPFSQALPSRE
jgi:hypothetical protein